MKIANVFLVAVFGLAACTGDGLRDSGGVRMKLTEPQIISPIEAATNLPKMYNVDKIVVKRMIRNNGAATWELYYHKGTLVAETEITNSGKPYNEHTMLRLEKEIRFRDNNELPGTVQLERPNDNRTYGFFTGTGENCDVGIGKAIGRSTYRGWPNAVLYIYSCTGLNKNYRGYMRKVVEGFDVMKSSDEAIIASRMSE